MLTYTPTLTTDTEVLMRLESSHALVEIPIRLVAGDAALSLTELIRGDADGDGIPDYLDLDSSSGAVVESKGVPVDVALFKGIKFGHFQIDPAVVREKTLYLRNTGSVAFSYRIKRAHKNKHITRRVRRRSVDLMSAKLKTDIIEEEEDDEHFPIRLSHWSGRLGPGDDQEIYVRVCQTKEQLVPCVPPPTNHANHANHLPTIRSDMRVGRFREELYVETELRGMVSFFVVDGHPDTGRFTEESSRRLKEGMHFGDCAVGNEKTNMIVLVNEGSYPMEIELKTDVSIGLGLQVTLVVEGGEGGEGGEVSKEHHEHHKHHEHQDHHRTKTTTTLLPPNGGRCTVEGTWVPDGKVRLNTSFVLHTSLPVLSGAIRHVVAVTGTGHYPSVSVSPEIVQCGIVALGYDTPNTFTLTNTGSCPVSWRVPYVPRTIWMATTSSHSGGRHSGNTAGKELQELMPQTSVDIDFTVHPMKRGWFSHELMICAPGT